MAQPPQIDLTIMAAEGLKNVSFLRSKMAPFAVAFVDPYSKHSTRVLAKGSKDPVWNDSMHIPIPPRALYDPRAMLTICVLNQGAVTTSIIGVTQLLLQDLFQSAALKGDGEDEGDILTLQLFRPSGRAHGIIRIFLKLSGDGLPGGRLLGNDFDGACYDSSPVTGIPAMPAMGIQSAATPRAVDYTKFAYPYPVAMYGQRAHMPYPIAPSPRPRRSNSNFLFGLVSGAIAAVLLGSVF